MARDLSGKVVVVTGSARGIGAAAARAFKDTGATVVISDIDQAALSEAAKALSPRHRSPLDSPHVGAAVRHRRSPRGHARIPGKAPCPLGSELKGLRSCQLTDCSPAAMPLT